MSVDLLELAAVKLAPLTDELVFVGGATIALWITEPAAPPTRATDDVDLICDAISYTEYAELSNQMRALSFSEDVESGVICRWKHKDGLVVDLMPQSADVLGFANRWYAEAMTSATPTTLPSGTEIRAVSPAMTVATKIEAWHGRGNNDVMRSLDVHDIVVLLNGRPELPAEIGELPETVRAEVQAAIGTLLHDPYFDYVIADAVASYGQASGARQTLVRERAQQLVADD